MRRRRPAGRALTAEELATADAEIRAQVRVMDASPEVRRYAHRQALAELGYETLLPIRARYWLRRGKPADYLWDQPNCRLPQPWAQESQ